MRKRKTAALLLAVSMLLTLVLTGCQPDQPAGDNRPQGSAGGEAD